MELMATPAGLCKFEGARHSWTDARANFFWVANRLRFIKLWFVLARSFAVTRTASSYHIIRLQTHLLRQIESLSCRRRDCHQIKLARECKSPEWACNSSPSHEYSQNYRPDTSSPSVASLCIDWGRRRFMFQALNLAFFPSASARNFFLLCLPFQYQLQSPQPIKRSAPKMRWHLLRTIVSGDGGRPRLQEGRAIYRFRAFLPFFSRG